MKRFLAFISAVVLISFFAGPAWCEYPERPITILVTMDAGGLTDLATRALSVNMEKYLGKSIIVENREEGAAP